MKIISKLMSLVICAVLMLSSGTLATEAATVKVSPPTKVTAVTTADTAKLSWAKVTKASGYKLYKKVDGKNIYGGYKTVKITVPYPAIYVTPTGKRYHFDKECAGKNAMKTTYAKAIMGRTPCKTCVL